MSSQSLTSHTPGQRRQSMKAFGRSYEKLGTNFLRLSGVDGHYASTQDANALDITGDIDLRVKIAADTYTATLSDYFAFLGKWDSASNQRQYLLQMNTAGKLKINWSSNGSANLSAVSTVVIGLANSAIKWLRGTLKVNDGAGNRIVKFSTSDVDNPVAADFTQLGDTITVAATTSIFSSGTFRVTIGPHDSAGTGGNQPGKMYRAQIYDGIDGTLVFDADFTKEKQGVISFIESSAQAAAVTVTIP